MAMLEAFVLSKELKKSAESRVAFARYESLLKPDILKRQDQTRRLVNRFVSSSEREITWNRWLTRLQFRSFLMHRTAKFFKGALFEV